MSLASSKIRRFAAIGLILLSFASGYFAGRAHLIAKARYRYLSQGQLLHSQSVAPENRMARQWWLDVTLRRYRIACDPGKYDTERSSNFYYARNSIPVDKAALILVDVWERHPNDGYLKRVREIIPIIAGVLQAARAHGMLIVHAPSGRPIAEGVKPLRGEIIIDASNEIADDAELHSTLQRHGIETLLYVGFAANMCLLDKPYGMKSMHSLGYQVVLLRNCTTAFEFHDTLDGMWATRLAVRHVECFLGSSTTSQDFLEGFRKRMP